VTVPAQDQENLIIWLAALVFSSPLLWLTIKWRREDRLLESVGAGLAFPMCVFGLLIAFSQGH
jgi:hypothetical protein